MGGGQGARGEAFHEVEPAVMAEEVATREGDDERLALGEERRPVAIHANGRGGGAGRGGANLFGRYGMRVERGEGEGGRGGGGACKRLGKGEGERRRIGEAWGAVIWERGREN